MASASRRMLLRTVLGVVIAAVAVGFGVALVGLRESRSVEGANPPSVPVSGPTLANSPSGDPSPSSPGPPPSEPDPPWDAGIFEGSELPPSEGALMLNRWVTHDGPIQVAVYAGSFTSHPRRALIVVQRYDRFTSENSFQDIPVRGVTGPVRIVDESRHVLELHSALNEVVFFDADTLRFLDGQSGSRSKTG